jgi:hypothetical protein
MISKKETNDVIFIVDKIMSKVIKRWGVDVFDLKNLMDILKKSMARKGFEYLGKGQERIVFDSKDYPDIVVKLSIFRTEENEKEIGVCEEVKTINNRYHRKKFIKIYGFSKDCRISICEKLFIPKWKDCNMNLVFMYFENMLGHIGVNCLRDDIDEKNLMVRSIGSTRMSDFVLADLGYSGEKRKILHSHQGAKNDKIKGFRGKR